MTDRSTNEDGERRLRVLAMDDQSSIRTMLERALTDQGHEVNVTDSWTEFSKAIFTSTPDVVVLDLNMPALPGERLAPIVRRYAPGSVIILLSGETEERLRSAAVAGVDHAFHKRELPQLLELLRTLAQKLRPATGAPGGAGRA